MIHSPGAVFLYTVSIFIHHAKVKASSEIPSIAGFLVKACSLGTVLPYTVSIPIQKA